MLTVRKRGNRRIFKFSEPFMHPFVIMKGIEDGLLKGKLRHLLRYNPQASLPI